MKKGKDEADNKRKQKKIFIDIVAFFYILFLLKLLLLSRVANTDWFEGRSSLLRSYNFTPFYSISRYSFLNVNVYGNIAIFIPLGVYILTLRKNKKIIPNFLIIFLSSLLVEVIQGVLSLGGADIDDLILNCLGGLIGILRYRFLLFALGNERKVETVITVVSAIGLPFLLYLLFGVTLRL